MDDEADRPKKSQPIILGENIETLSIEEIEERIVACEAEIERLRTLMQTKHRSRDAADAVFKL